MDSTNEFSFILKPSSIQGVGVFTTHDIKKGAFLRLFANDENPEQTRLLNKEEVPKAFRGYCMDRGSHLSCPDDFGWIKLGWYLNHSKEKANAEYRGWECFAKRDIAAGEEILIDYNELQEPEEAREEYYKN